MSISAGGADSRIIAAPPFMANAFPRIPLSSVDAPSLSAPRLAAWTIVVIVVAALVLALAGAVALNAGAHLRGTPPTIVVPATAMTIARGQGRATDAGLRLDATAPGDIGLLSAPDVVVDGDAYSRITWRFGIEPSGGVDLAMTWSRRDRPGTVYSAPIDWTRGDATIDLTRHADWGGAVHGIGLAVRGRLSAPMLLADASLRSNAWDATLADIVDDWFAGSSADGTSAMTSMRHEARQVAPLLPIVAAAIALGAGFVVWRNRRRRETIDAGAIVAIVLAGWLVLDLRMQALLWQQHAASWSAFAGRTLDEKRAAERDAPIFSVARRLRDAERPRGGRVLVLSDSPALATRVAWFLYPDNVWVDTRRSSAGQPPPLPPDALRRGDQVVLILKRGFAWDAAGGRLVWPDGRTREARAILVDGPDIALLEIR